MRKRLSASKIRSRKIKDAEIERSNKLLSLISYDQESGFIKNMAIIESNNNQYLGCGDLIKLCGLEAVEAVFGVHERNKMVRKLCQRIAEKYAQCLRYRDIQCRSLFTSVSGSADIYP